MKKNIFLLSLFLWAISSFGQTKTFEIEKVFNDSIVIKILVEKDDSNTLKTSLTYLKNGETNFFELKNHDFEVFSTMFVTKLKELTSHELQRNDLNVTTLFFQILQLVDNMEVPKAGVLSISDSVSLGSLITVRDIGDIAHSANIYLSSADLMTLISKSSRKGKRKATYKQLIKKEVITLTDVQNVDSTILKVFLRKCATKQDRFWFNLEALKLNDIIISEITPLYLKISNVDLEFNDGFIENMATHGDIYIRDSATYKSNVDRLNQTLDFETSRLDKFNEQAGCDLFINTLNNLKTCKHPTDYQQIFSHLKELKSDINSRTKASENKLRNTIDLIDFHKIDTSINDSLKTHVNLSEIVRNINQLPNNQSIKEAFHTLRSQIEHSAQTWKALKELNTFDNTFTQWEKKHSKKKHKKMVDQISKQIKELLPKYNSTDDNSFTIDLQACLKNISKFDIDNNMRSYLEVMRECLENNDRHILYERKRSELKDILENMIQTKNAYKKRINDITTKLVKMQKGLSAYRIFAKDAYLTNSAPIGISTKLAMEAPKQKDQLCGYTTVGGKQYLLNANVHEILKYNPHFSVNMKNYSPANGVHSFKGGQRDIVLKKAERESLFDAKIFTDLNMYGSNKKAGVLQTEVSKCIPIKTWRFKSHNFRAVNIGYFQNITPFVRLKRIEDSNYTLALSRSESNKFETSLIELYRNERYQVGCTMNLLVLDFPHNKLNCWFDFGARLGQVKCNDTTNIANNKKNDFLVNTMYVFSKFKCKFYPDPRYGIEFSSNVGYYNALNDDIVRENDPNITTGNFYWLQDLQMLVTYRFTPRNRIFLKYKLSMPLNNWDNNFTQILLGYSIDIFGKIKT